MLGRPEVPTAKVRCEVKKNNTGNLSGILLFFKKFNVGT